ncbi:MAG TPA: FAD-dependent monooxygenase [Xanthobacteraceae bacterium]|nr:FAD-dependent monooxygenase [Xanthobacteraceae bacterium]
MKVAIIGGGPAGLYFARLMKRSRPDADIVVFEQNPREATYGFGVTLGGSARERMRRIDEDVHDRLAGVMLFNNRQIIRLDDEEVLLEYAASGGAIARLQLLNILQQASEEIGVVFKDGVRIVDLGQFAEFDLVVAADGVNSFVRSQFGADFGTRQYFLNNHFAWYGVGREMKPNALVFRHAHGGVFVAHYYAYAENMSTFVAECDGATWDRCGLAALDARERRTLIEDIFANELDGAPLIDNKSDWRQFNVVSNERWVRGNIVLLGDAQRAAHFSIGSGTRLAMDDAAALHQAFEEAGSDAVLALARFVDIRKPIRDQFALAAERSFNWYEAMGDAMRANVMDFTYDFLTRTGRVDDVRLKDYVPAFYRDYQRYRSREPEAVQQ